MRCASRWLAPARVAQRPLARAPRAPQLLGNGTYARAAAARAAPARLLSAARPPLEAAVVETELALLHGGYGRWAPYPRAGGGGGRQASSEEL